MKKTLFLFATLISMIAANAQKKEQSTDATLFGKGTKVGQVGLGLGSSIGLPVGAHFEYGVTDKIGVGPYVGYASKSYNLLGSKYRVSSIIIAARGNYHFYQNEKIDAYGGAILGYNAASAKWVGSSTLPITTSYGGVTWGALIGARYYFKPSIAVFGELGYGLGYLTIGIAKKF